MLEFLEQELSDTPVGRANGVEVVIGERPFVNEKILQKGNGLDNAEEIKLGNRTIIIRNRIDWAKKTAQSLRAHDEDLEVYLLHSELLPKDRKKVEDQAKKVFGKNAESDTKKHVLIATQVVEAGIDISCDVMHTDLCPPSSLIQRIGRSARYAGESSTVFWHDVEESDYAPYSYAKSDMNELKKLLSINDGQMLDNTLENQS